MLRYEDRVRAEFDAVRRFAEELRGDFASEAPAEVLQERARHLATRCASLLEKLPPEVREKTSLQRHLYFMDYWLGKNEVEKAAVDIDDICVRDLSELQGHFVQWCQSSGYYHPALIEKLGDLLTLPDADAAVRKAFLVLKTRLVAGFKAPRDLDGVELVNWIFARPCPRAAGVEGKEREAMRSLLAGLYGLVRNRFAHDDVGAPWDEGDALLSIINLVLKRIDTY